MVVRTVTLQQKASQFESQTFFVWSKHAHARILKNMHVMYISDFDLTAEASMSICLVWLYDRLAKCSGPLAQRQPG